MNEPSDGGVASETPASASGQAHKLRDEGRTKIEIKLALAGVGVAESDADEIVNAVDLSRGRAGHPNPIDINRGVAAQLTHEAQHRRAEKPPPPQQASAPPEPADAAASTDAELASMQHDVVFHLADGQSDEKVSRALRLNLLLFALGLTIAQAGLRTLILRTVDDVRWKFRRRRSRT